MADQLDPGQEEEEAVKDGEDEDKEVEQRVPATTMASEGPRVQGAKKKYTVVLPYVRGSSVPLAYLHTLSQPTLSSNYTTCIVQGQGREGKSGGSSLSHYL